MAGKLHRIFINIGIQLQIILWNFVSKCVYHIKNKYCEHVHKVSNFFDKSAKYFDKNSKFPIMEEKVAKKLAKIADEDKEIQIELIPSLEPKLGRVYANYVQVSHSPYDFTIRFCEAPSVADIVRLKGNRKKVEVPNIVELIIPPDLMPQIIEALKINYEKYLKAYKEKENETNN